MEKVLFVQRIRAAVKTVARFVSFSILILVCAVLVGAVVYYAVAACHRFHVMETTIGCMLGIAMRPYLMRAGGFARSLVLAADDAIMPLGRMFNLVPFSQRTSRRRRRGWLDREAVTAEPPDNRRIHSMTG